MPLDASWTSTSTWPGPGRVVVMTRSTGWSAKLGTPHTSVSTRWPPISALVPNELRAVTATTFGSFASCAHLRRGQHHVVDRDGEVVEPGVGDFGAHGLVHERGHRQDAEAGHRQGDRERG